MTKLSLTAAILASAVALAAPAGAAQLTFFGEDLNANTAFVPNGNAAAARADFLANLEGVGNEDFETFSDGTTAPIGLTFPGSAGNITATLVGFGNIQQGANGLGRFPTSGTKLFGQVGTGFRIDFSAPISAFGFYATDIGDFNGQVTLEFANGVTTNLTVPNTLNGPNGSLLFYGFIDTVNGYDSVVFGNTNAGNDFFGFDDLVIGDLDQVDPVPAPAALALFGLGLAGVAVARRR